MKKNDRLFRLTEELADLDRRLFGSVAGVAEAGVEECGDPGQPMPATMVYELFQRRDAIRQKIEKIKQAAQERPPRLVECPKPKQAVMLFKLLGYAGILPGAEKWTAATLARITGDDPDRYGKALERVKPGDYNDIMPGDLFEDAIERAEKDLERPKRKPRRPAR